jgi:(1->4)-alpha-D-glucan 1-alpha-D-glucosylmutase
VRIRTTYRVQVRPDFDLDAAAALADYLVALGISHLYSAPLLQAAPGSEHGYDVVDHSRVNAELGGEPGRQRLATALRAAGLGLVVDVVPNHAGVAVPAANPPWWDVLKLGRESEYAGWFDIDWSRAPILVPILGDDGDGGAAALEQLRVEDGELRYFEHRLPVAPGTGEGSPREVHQRQHYRLVSWRRANSEINYRRFFAVNTLAALRVEDPAIFDATHREVLRWVAEGDADGIRVDHPDGLRDPAGYLRMLRAAAGADTWLVVEKILEHGEELPDWPVDGTTGYEDARLVCGVFVDPGGEDAFTALDTELTGTPTDWPRMVHDAKLVNATVLLRAELLRLVRLAKPTPADAPNYAAALAELLANFPVYRSYLPDGVEHLEQAAAAALRCRPDLAAVFDALLPRLRDPAQELAVRFQQLSGAVMAKSVEDTAFYRWTRFVALNEVGGDPAAFGVTPAELHRAGASRRRSSMTTLSTHDTKRSEDVRARLAVLSELPAEWAAAVRGFLAAAPLPDAGFAHLLWQCAVGAWPIGRDRLHAYAEKASREAGVSTTWDNPDAVFEAAMHAAVDALYDEPKLADAVAGFAERITPAGWSNSLGQKLVQLAMPGVPDTYQGTELWDNSLVDPDNRRPVDFALRRELLARLDGGWLPPVDETGAAKLLVVSRTLRARRDRPDAFTGYASAQVSGPMAEHAVAFDTGGALAVATRLPVRLAAAGGWGRTTVEVPWDAVDALTGAGVPTGLHPLGDLLARYPVSLLLPG